MAGEIRTESDVQGLIGESESMTLEFKGPEDFAVWPQKKENVAEDLSKAVSAFANTYGGQIILGMRETRESPHKAEGFVGMHPTKPSVETLQRLVESNVRPRLDGIRYNTIELSGKNEGLVLYVIVVPQGRTAYQARNKLYYGRSEYESVPLEDQLIRYKMIRDRVREAQIEVIDVSVNTAECEYAARQQQLTRRIHNATANEARVILRSEQRAKRAKLEAPRRTFDEYSFRLAIRNGCNRAGSTQMPAISFNRKPKACALADADDSRTPSACG